MKKLMLAALVLALIAPSYALAQGKDAAPENEAGVSTDANPRGLSRPHDGRGGGTGMRNGKRGGQNQAPCPEGGSGYGSGQGASKGQNRQDK